MNDPTRPPLPVSATALLRYLVVAEVEALVLRGWPAGAAVRHVAGSDRVDLYGPPAAGQRTHPATLARSLGERQARRAGAAAAHPNHNLTGAESGTGHLSAHREAT